MNRARRLGLRESYRERAFRVLAVFFLGLLGVVVLVAGLVWFGSNPSFTLARVNVSGETSLDAEIINAKVEAFLETPVLFLLSRRTIFTVDKVALEQALLDSFPVLESAQVEWSGKNELTLSLSDREAIYVWRSQTHRSDTDAEGENIVLAREYLVDKYGYIFAPKDGTINVSDGAFVFMGGDVGGSPVGRYVDRKDIFQNILSIRGVLIESGLNVVSVVSHKGAKEGDLEFITDDGWKLLVVESEKKENVVRSLGAALEAIDKNAKDGKMLEYVDVRFPNKAYFRYALTAPQSPQATPEAE